MNDQRYKFTVTFVDDGGRMGFDTHLGSDARVDGTGMLTIYHTIYDKDVGSYEEWLVKYAAGSWMTVEKSYD